LKKARSRFLTTASSLVSVGLACALHAQVYQVGQGASQSPQAPRTKAPAPQTQTQNAQSLGWGSNIQNARLARAAQLAIQHGDKAQAVDFAQRAAQAAPNDPQLWFLLGYAARVDARYQLSLDAYNRGMKLSPDSLDGLSGIAQDYNIMGRSSDAETLLLKIVTADPRRHNDVQLLGEIYMKGRDYTTAIDWLTKAERQQADARTELLLALCYQQLKQMDKASHYLDMARHRAPNNPDVLRSLAGYYRETGNYTEAVNSLKAIRNPSPDIMAELGYTYQLDGKLNDSARLYRQAANAVPKDIALQLSAAQAEVATGSMEDANIYLDRAQRIDANSYRLHAIRGEIAQMQDRTQDAAREYQEAIAHLPAAPAEGPLYGIQLHMDMVALDHALDDTAAAQQQLQIAQNQIDAVDQASVNREQFLRLRSLIKLNAGDSEGALTDVKDALAANPNDRNNLQLNGDILMKLGRTDDAIAVYKRILDQDAKNRFALTSLGYAERTAGRDSEAEKYFQRLAQADPKLYVPYLALGDLYTARHHYARAQAEYTRALALAPHNALIMAGGMNAAIEAHDLKLAAVWLGRTNSAMDREPQILREKERYYSFMGNYQESASIGQRAIQVLPHDRDVVVYLGYDYLYMNRYNELLALTKKYMDVLPKEPDIPLLQGYVYKHDNQSELAREDFSEAIKRDPNVETAYVNRGYMLNDLHLASEAAADFSTAVKMDPKDGQAHLGLAYADLDMNKAEGALHEANVAEKTMGDIRDVHVIRATAYARENLLSKAIAEYRAALRFTPRDGALRLGLGNSLLALRRYHEAIAELEQAAQDSPEDPTPDALLARGYADLNDRPQTIHFATIAEQRAQSSPGPVQSQTFVTTGEALSELGDQAGAMDRFSKALEVKGSDRVGVRMAIAQLMTQQNRPQAAERQIALGLMEAEAGDTAPPTGSEYIAAADIFRSLHDYELSQNYLQRAKTAGAPDAEVRIGLANNYLAVGDTGKAAAELDAVAAANPGSDPNYQFLLAQANVYRQQHQGALALTSFAQASNASGDDQSAEQSMLQAGADEGLRVTPNLSLLSDYSIAPVYEDTTVYVLDSKLDALQPIPPNNFALLPGPRSSFQNQWTDAFHLHWKNLPTPTGFFQVRNARGPISAPSSYCGPGTTSSSICTLVINRNTTDYNMNIGVNPTFRFGRNMLAFNTGVQGTIRRDSLQPAQMNQNLLRVFVYGSTSSFFNAVSASGYFIRESGPFTENNLHSRALTGAIDFRIGSPWGKTALVTGWGATDQLFTPHTFEAYFTSSYIGLEHQFSHSINVRGLVEDLRAWRIVNTSSAIAQSLRPAGTVSFSPHRQWQVHLNGAYSSTRGFHVYDAVQSGISVSYAMPFRRKFEAASGPLNLAYPIRFSAGVQDEDFFNFKGGQQQIRPYFEISIF
jgi:tetratricopeptide (TPR) repeat protein